MIDTPSEKPKLERADLIFLADNILHKLKSLERFHPYLNSESHYPGYLTAKRAVEEEYCYPSDDEGVILRIAYNNLIRVLNEIAEGRKTIPQIGPRGLPLYQAFKFFPSTFEKLLENYLKTNGPQRSKIAIEAAAEAIIMGELNEGLNRVIDSLRREVQEKIIELLTYDDGEIEYIQTIIYTFGLQAVLEMLTIEDEELIELSGEKEEDKGEVDLDTLEPAQKIARLIIWARDRIDREHHGSEDYGKKQRAEDAAKIIPPQTKPNAKLKIVK